MKHNIIGDIHGRSVWKKLIDLDCINIFVGDYFDPYEYEDIDKSFEAVKSNFLDILYLKKHHPDKIILLYGNHDFHYIYFGNEASRFDSVHAHEIQSLFMDNKDLFYGICYTFDLSVVTHAGITKEWYNRFIGQYSSESLYEIETNINSLWNSDDAENAFRFSDKAFSYDYEGITPLHSPIWIRPETLVYHNLFGPEVTQIFGHTQQIDEDFFNVNNCICVDVLGFNVKSLKI